MLSLMTVEKVALGVIIHVNLSLHGKLVVCLCSCQRKRFDIHVIESKQKRLVGVV
jgi:hypothetical protein